MQVSTVFITLHRNKCNNMVVTCLCGFLIKRRILELFLRTTQNLLMLALLYSLYSKQTFKLHLGVEKYIER